MIIGIGMDIVEIPRIEALLKRKPGFARRILTEREMSSFNKLSERRKAEYLAGRFSAKEAYSKAAGTGIGAALSFLDIEIGRTAEGKPLIRGPVPGISHVTITHSREYAAAQVVIESAD